MQTSNMNLLTDAMRGASKFLHRDYCELENLQGSSKNTKAFVEKAKDRVGESLHKALSKYYKTVVFNPEAIETLDFQGTAALVEIIDGTENFERAIPFFASVVTILGKKQEQIFADKVVMNFPALGDIYYAEKGKGAWL